MRNETERECGCRTRAARLLSLLITFHASLPSIFFSITGTLVVGAINPFIISKWLISGSGERSWLANVSNPDLLLPQFFLAHFFIIFPPKLQIMHFSHETGRHTE